MKLKCKSNGLKQYSHIVQLINNVMYMIVATYNNLHVTIASGNNFNKNF